MGVLVVAEVHGPARARRAARRTGPLGEPAFVGRRAELAVLVDLLTGRAGATPRVVIVEGEAGIGKSRLVSEALAAVPQVTALRGRAEPLDRHRSVAAVTAALDPLDAAAPAEARLAAMLAGAGHPRVPIGPGLRTQLVDAAVAAVAGRARGCRVVLVLEDLHWADDGTSAVLGEFSEPVPGRDVVVLGTRRGTPRPVGMRHLDAVTPAQRLRVLPLAPLDPGEVADLVTGRVGRPPSDDLTAHVARAGGNPLYVGELLDALAEQGSLVHGADAVRTTVDVTGASLPPSLRITLLRRLSGLPDSALDALRLAALLGTSFAVEDLAAALDEPVPATVARLDEPLRAGWLRGDGRQLRFRHDLVRDALHDDTPEAVRRGLHRHLADRLAAAGRAPHEVAHHLVLGATPPDLEAATWLHAAGRRASSREPRAAVELLEAALLLDPTSGRRRDAVEVELAVARCWAGQVGAGESELRELLARPHDPGVDTEVRLALARSLILGGDSADALEVLASDSRPDRPAPERARLEAERCLANLLRGDLDGAHAAADLVLATVDADDESRCLVHATRAALLALAGRSADAVDAGRRAVAIAASSRERETARRPPQLFLGSVLLDADRFDEGWQLLHEGRRTSELLGAVWDLPLVHLITARGRYLVGDLDDCLAEAETALHLADEVGTRVLEVWGHALVAHVHLHRTDRAAVEVALRAGEQVVGRTGPEVRGMDWLVWARARALAQAGDHEVARQLLVAVWDGHRRRGMRSERRLLGPELVALHLSVGDRAAAEEVAGAVEELAELAGTPSTAAAALHVRGRVAGDPALLVAAATATADTPCRTEHVAQALAAADLLRVLGRVEDAIGWYGRAAEVAGGAGMTRAARRAGAALRELGVRSGVRGRRTRAVTGWEALTPTERAVAELAAQGLSNPEVGDRLYISRRTVQTHLSRVYAKLAIASRVELAAVVARRA